jgi:hypothetical protein
MEVAYLTEANMPTKQELHQLVDSLPLKEIAAAKRYLQFLLSQKDEGDPLLSALMDAPEDDEPLTPEELEAIEEGRRDIARGDTQPWDEVKKELGLL